jgi:site-specific DNA recombinase
VGDTATDRHAGARLADLHERIEAKERRAQELRGTIERASATLITREQVDGALGDFQGLWSKLSPRERHELVRLLIQRIDYDAAKGSVAITFHQMGLRTIGQRSKEHAA